MKNDFTTRLKKIDAILENELPQNYSDSWLDNTFAKTYAPIPTNLLESLVIPCRELLLLGGKRWRPLFMVLCSELALENNTTLSEDEKNRILERVYSLTPIIEFVHTASLIHDDIEDAADMRRGKPSAYITYGIDTAINCGSWLYFQATKCLSDKINIWQENEQNLKISLYEQLTLELRRLHLGQAMDISWHKNNEIVPTISEYLTMTSLKTGTLASLSAKLGLLASGESVEKAQIIATAAAQIGIAFQIIDDIKNLTTGNVGKKRGDDIVEGKKSLPVLFHLESNKDDFEDLMQCFRMARKEGIDSKYVEAAIAIIEKSNAIEKARTKASELLQDACKTIKDLYTNCNTTTLIEDLFTSMC